MPIIRLFPHALWQSAPATPAQTWACIGHPSPGQPQAALASPGRVACAKRRLHPTWNKVTRTHPDSDQLAAHAKGMRSLQRHSPQPRSAALVNQHASDCRRAHMTHTPYAANPLGCIAASGTLRPCARLARSSLACRPPVAAPAAAAQPAPRPHDVHSCSASPAAPRVAAAHLPRHGVRCRLRALLRLTHCRRQHRRTSACSHVSCQDRQSVAALEGSALHARSVPAWVAWC